MDALEVFREFRKNGEHIVKHYVTDYDIDLYFMARYEFQNEGKLPPIIHITREMGTHTDLMYPENMLPKEGEQVPYLFGYVNREQFIENIGSSVEYFSTPCNKLKEIIVQYYDGEFVKIISLGEALKIVQEHKDSLRGIK